MLKWLKRLLIKIGILDKPKAMPPVEPPKPTPVKFGEMRHIGGEAFYQDQHNRVQLWQAKTIILSPYTFRFKVIGEINGEYDQQLAGQCSIVFWYAGQKKTINNVGFYSYRESDLVTLPIKIEQTELGMQNEIFDQWQK